MSEYDEYSKLREAMASSRDSRKEEMSLERELKERRAQEEAIRVENLKKNLKKPFSHIITKHPQGYSEEFGEEDSNLPQKMCPMCGHEHESDDKMERDLSEDMMHRIMRRRILQKRLRRSGE